MLQRYDLERDDTSRKFQAAMWGVDLKDAPVKPSNGRPKQQKMTQQDIMRSYG